MVFCELVVTGTTVSEQEDLVKKNLTNFAIQCIIEYKTCQGKLAPVHTAASTNDTNDR